MSNSSWTTTPPTEPGWYWSRGLFRVTVPEWREIIQVVSVEYDTAHNLIVYNMGTEIPDRVSDYTHWIGPLSVPASPSSPSENVSPTEPGVSFISPSSKMAPHA